MTLADDDLGVCEAVPLLGQGEEGLYEDGELFDADRQFAGLGSEQFARNAEEVADIEQLDELVLLFTDDILAKLNLKLA